MKKFRVLVIYDFKKIMIITAVILIIGVFFGVLAKQKTAKEAMAAPLGNKVILIDPGHGGIDKGASDNGAAEKDLNLSIALILKSYIEENGGICYLTRVVDTNTADPDRSKNVSQKMSDLKTRKSDIDLYKADIFISIHMNKFGESKYKGLQVFYDGASNESKKLADAIQQSAKALLDPENNRKAKATGDKIYVLKGNNVPSVLVECGFLSNKEEAEKLKTPQYQRKVAWGIYMGIMDYFSR